MRNYLMYTIEGHFDRIQCIKRTINPIRNTNTPRCISFTKTELFMTHLKDVDAFIGCLAHLILYCANPISQINDSRQTRKAYKSPKFIELGKRIWLRHERTTKFDSKIGFLSRVRALYLNSHTPT